MVTIFLAAWLYLAAHAAIGEALDTPRCLPESECDCSLNCYDESE